MDNKFDLLTKSVAGGISRRQALRMLGGGMASAVLATLGMRERANAQGPPIFTNCTSGRPEIDTEGEQILIQLPCGQCPEGMLCAALLNPANRLICRCIRV